ncbi:MAG: oxidoreductase [Halobacteriales archaeon SW_9_67_25]|nr:MAG: oxidoreductase [Halobacteriales archaeon SW_9_67_25]
MSGHERGKTVGELPSPGGAESRVPLLLTRVVWSLWAGSLVALVGHLVSGWSWAFPGVVAVDGLTVVMWATVTFFSGIVHSYSRRYMAGSRYVDRFFGGVFAFTLVVMALVAADSAVLFGLAWLAMGLVMAELIGAIRGWPQARTAAAFARRYFLASSALVGLALGTLWWDTGATTIGGMASALGASPSVPVLFAAGALLLAAMIQSALLPFHSWLLASMTAPTPASALMHAGFVNAGGILLVRFAPVATVDSRVMLAVLLVGAASALGGKLLKSVQSDVKGQLGCSTVGQMGFMLMQAGLGFFGAAITHLVLHGFYKAYHFLASGGQVAHESPAESAPREVPGPLGVAVIGLTALAGGGVFVALTGKGTGLDSGLLLTLLVVLTVMHAAREVVAAASVPTAVRYGAVPLVAIPALAIYAAFFNVVAGLLAGLPAVGGPAELTVVHGLVAVAFVVAYLAIESGAYRYSTRLYVALVNTTYAPAGTLLTSTEEYNEH